MFYESVWEYQGFRLVKRPDTSRYAIYWKPRRSSRYRCQSTGTSDLEAAKRKLIDFAHEQSGPPKLTADRLPLLEAVTDYITQHAHATKSYESAAKAALKHLLGFVDSGKAEYVSDFTLAAQNKYIAWRRSQLKAEGFTASNGTLNRELGVFKAAMRRAWKHGRLESVPHVQMLPSPPPRDRFLRVPEVRRLLEASTQPHLRMYVMLALHTLQRPVALYDLRVEQVDLESGRIDFLPPGTLQSKKRRPVVPITPSLRPYLERAVAESCSGYVLEFDGMPVKSIKRAFATACRNAGLRDVTPYVLRRTGATLMAAAGVPLRQIAGMLGHSELRTAELYMQHHPDYLSDASRVLDTLFGDGGDKGRDHLTAAPTLRQLVLSGPTSTL